MIRHVVLALATLLALDVAGADADDLFRPGKVELHATPIALGIELPYQGDDNHNASVKLFWRSGSEESWRNGVEVTWNRKRRLVWASIWPLEPGTACEVKLEFADPDAPPQSLPLSITTVTTPKLILSNQGGRTFFVSPQGDDANTGTQEAPFRTLAHAAKQVQAGDTVLALNGVYAEGDLGAGLKGTAGKPIIFAAAPGHKPVLDSSHVIAAGEKGWQKVGPDVHAIAVEFEGSAHSYVAQDGKRLFRYSTLADLQKDKSQSRRAWFYDPTAKKLYIRTGTGQPPATHRYNLSRHHYAFHLSRSRHVVIRGFTVRYYGAAAVRLSEGATGCVICENIIHNVTVGIYMKSPTTADNLIWRNELFEVGLADFTWNAIKQSDQGRQAVYCDRAGRGNSFCYNKIHGWFDGIAVESWRNPDKLEYNRDCDICFNEIYNCGDDAIEADGGGVNMRIHGNAIRHCLAAISLAPVERGPVYVTFNHASFLGLFFKFNVGGCTSHGPTYCYHNSGYTLLATSDGGTAFSFPPGIPCTNKVLKNNIVICSEYSVRAGKKGYLLDHNCYFSVPGLPPRRFQWEGKVHGTLSAFAAATGQEKHGLYANPQFLDTPGLGTLRMKDLGSFRLSDYPLVESGRLGDLRLRPGSPCIDRGEVLRGINDSFRGKGPDLGAFESDNK